MTLDDIKARCEEIGECWEWRTDARTDRAKRHPMIGKGVLVRRVAYEAQYGALSDKHSLAPRCDNPYCLNPQHQKVLTFKQKSARGGGYSPTRAASVARTRRAKGLNKVTPEMAQEIRTSTETGVALARRMGVDEKTIANVRQGTILRDYGNPFTALLAANDSARRAA